MTETIDEQGKIFDNPEGINPAWACYCLLLAGGVPATEINLDVIVDAIQYCDELVGYDPNEG